MITSTGFNVIRSRAWVAALGIAVLLAHALAGCRSPRQAETRPVFERWQDFKQRTEAALSAVEEGSRVEPVDEEPHFEIVTEPDSRFVGFLPTNIIKRLDIPQRTDVGLVIRALAKAADQNVLVSRGVAGEVDFTLREVRWNEAFEGLLATSGLTYIWDGDVIKVMTLEDLRHDLEIKRITQEHIAMSAQIRNVQPLVTRVFKIRYANASRLGENLKEVMAVGTGEFKAPGSLTVDEGNNTIVIHAVPDEVIKLASIIEQLDKAKPQVLIEAKIIETNSETARELGIQWGGMGSYIADGRRYIIAPQAGDLVPGMSARSSVNFPVDLIGGRGMALGFMSDRFGGGELLNVQLTALQNDGRLDILSSPSITTLDNETALIESGEERAYLKASGAGSLLTTTVEWKPALLKLEVTPQVIDGNRLRMQISAMKEEFDESKAPVDNQFPKSTKRAETTVMLRNGQTTVIGGLSKELERKSESGVPFLKNIPLIGYFFKGSGRRAVNDEILIFITPYILGEDAVSL